MVTRLIIIRHAEAEGNFQRIFHGWTNSELTEKGHTQARLMAEKIKDLKFDIIYSSSMKRTLQTAEYIAEGRNLPIIRTDKLKEINGGDWEGRYFKDIKEFWPEQYDCWENRINEHSMPNGESVEEFQKRLIEEIEYIVGNNKGKNICVVTHGTAIRALMCYFKGCAFEEMCNINWVENTSVSILEHSEEGYKLLVEGDASHLDESMGTLTNQDWYKEHQKKMKGN